MPAALMLTPACKQLRTPITPVVSSLQVGNRWSGLENSCQAVQAFWHVSGRYTEAADLAPSGRKERSPSDE